MEPHSVTSVTVEETGTGKAVTLTPPRAEQLLQEIGRVEARPPTTGTAPRVGPDCTITIRPVNGPQKTYKIFGQTVINEPETNRTWAFPLGKTVLGWLDEPDRGGPP